VASDGRRRPPQTGGHLDTPNGPSITSSL